MIAGFLSKFGKIGVILGFVAGNVLLAYVANGNTEEIIYLFWGLWLRRMSP